MRNRTLCALLCLCLFGCNAGRDRWIADLQSPRPEERATAVRKLSERFSDEDVLLFTQAARDPVGIVRAEAFTALGKSQDPRVVDLLAEALGDQDERVQEAAASALTSLRSDKARAYLALQYGRRGARTRQLIVDALKRANMPGAMASVVAAEANSLWERNLKALTSGAMPERAGAAEALGRSGRPEAVDRLVPLLRDTQVVLAAAAARGLGFSGDPRAVPALIAVLKENAPDLREAACEALASLRAVSALQPLTEVALERSRASALAVNAIVAMPREVATDKALCSVALNGPSPEAAAAGREMRKRGGCPPEPIAEKLKSQATAPSALWALVALGPTSRDFGSKIAPFLSAPDSSVRRLAVEALSESQDPMASAVLLKAFEAEQKLLEPLRGDWVPGDLPLTYGPGFDPNMPPPPANEAGRIRTKQVELFRRVQELHQRRAQEAGKVMVESKAPRELIDDASEEQVKALAVIIRALGKAKTEGMKEKVELFTRESSAQLRASAFYALAVMGDIDKARRGLFEPERLVQSATAMGLAESEAGQAALLETAVQLLGDRSWVLDAFRGEPVSRRGAAALLKLLGEGGREAGEAALLLAEAQATEAVEPIVSMLKDPTVIARRELVVALGRLKDPRAADAIARELFSDSVDVREAAIEALTAVNGRNALEQLDALKGDYAQRVRTAADLAMKTLAPEAKP